MCRGCEPASAVCREARSGARSLDRVLVEVGELAGGGEVDASRHLLLHPDVGRLLVEPDPHPLQLAFDDLLLRDVLHRVEDDDEARAGARDRDHLPAAALAVPRALDDLFHVIARDVLAEEELRRTVARRRVLKRGERRDELTRAVPSFKATSGWSSKASEAELKGIEVCRD